MTTKRRAGSVGVPAGQVDDFIAKFDPAVARLLRGARRELRRRFPTAVELVYDNYNALAIGFSSTERTSDVIVSLAGYPRGVNLYFMYGAHLADPARRLQGAGNQGRFVRLTELAVLDDPAVVGLLKAAVDNGDTPLPRSGRGYTVIKSISAKQRSRRPRD
jgi:hypothetical protein